LKTRTGLQSAVGNKCYAVLTDGIVPEPRMHPEKSRINYVTFRAEVHLVTKLYFLSGHQYSINERDL